MIRRMPFILIFFFFFFGGLQRPHFILKTNDLQEQALRELLIPLPKDECINDATIVLWNSAFEEEKAGGNYASLLKVGRTFCFVDIVTNYLESRGNG